MSPVYSVEKSGECDTIFYCNNGIGRLLLKKKNMGYTYEDVTNNSAIRELLLRNDYLVKSCKGIYSEVYIINTLADTFEEVVVDEIHKNVRECGKYTNAITEHFDFGRIHPMDATGSEGESIEEFLSIPNIVEKLKTEKKIEKRYKRTLHDGSIQWCLTTIVPCETVDGYPTVVLMLIQNIDNIIAEEERLNASLARAIKSTNEAIRAKSLFLSRMSHDIRTPANVIAGMAEIAKKYVNDPARVADSLEKIYDEANHLLVLINDVLDLSSLESGKLTIKPEKTNILTLFDRIDTSSRNLVLSRDIDYSSEEKNIICPFVLADTLRITQIYNNLISNAVKFTPDGGRVKFEFWQTKSDARGKVNLCARVSDTGIGMSDEFMKNMYFEYAREDDKRVNNIQGTGLGLAIVKQLVDMLDGTIDVKSARNEGTEITVIIPLDTVDRLDVFKAPDKKVDFERVKGLKVLVAEDYDLNYEISKELLNGVGMEVSRAENGKEAYDIIVSSKQGDFDLILMDMRMPVMDGVESTKYIRAIDDDKLADIPIIAMTANAFEEDAKACLDSGMDDYITKPVKIDDLVERIINVLDRKQITN